jgi:hypothetical protein
MALKLNERYPGRFNSPNAQYPQGSFKNRTAPGAKDGSYLEQDWANDELAFFSSLLSGASITPNGQVDTVGASQYYTALQNIVKKAGLEFNKIFTFLVSGAIPLSHLGGEIVVNGSGDIALSLPTTVGLDPGLYGKLIILLNASSGDVTLTAAGADSITAGADSVSSIVIKSGDRAIISLASANFWHLIGGEASLKYSGSFKFSNTQNGYQKLPTGMILQWGITNNALVNPQTVNLPVAFPNVGLVIVASDASGSYTPTTVISICSGRYLSNSQIQVASAYQYNVLGSDSIQWFAIGY